jgi:hypothetical protein
MQKFIHVPMVNKERRECCYSEKKSVVDEEHSPDNMPVHSEMNRGKAAVEFYGICGDSEDCGSHRFSEDFFSCKHFGNDTFVQDLEEDTVPDLVDEYGEIVL